MHGERPALVTLGIQLDDLDLGVACARSASRSSRARARQARSRGRDQHVGRHTGSQVGGRGWSGWSRGQDCSWRGRQAGSALERAQRSGTPLRRESGQLRGRRGSPGPGSRHPSETRGGRPAQPGVRPSSTPSRTARCPARRSRHGPWVTAVRATRQPAGRQPRADRRPAGHPSSSPPIGMPSTTRDIPRARRLVHRQGFGGGLGRAG